MFKPVCTLLLCVVMLSGCITNSLLTQAPYDRQSQKIKRVKDVYTDSTGALLINFTAKKSWIKRRVAMHLRIPADSLLQYYTSCQHSIQPIQDSCAPYAMSWWISGGKSQYHHGPIVELTSEHSTAGFQYPPHQDSIHGQLELPTQLTHYNNFAGNGSRYTGTRMVMIYVPEHKPDTSNKYASQLIIAFPPSKHKRYYRYGMLPLTVAEDIVTGPFQGLALLIANAMGY